MGLDISTLVERARAIKATGGKPSGNSTSQGFKVRKNYGSLFVGAFCQSNVGDVTPNVLGAFCIDSGKPFDFNHSSCHGDDQLCMGRGPGYWHFNLNGLMSCLMRAHISGFMILWNRYPDEILSTQIIGERQYQKAVDLFVSATEELTGKVDYRHVYLNFTDIEVGLDGNNVVKTCPAALGAGFAAGTTDGSGAFGFQQGDTKVMIVFYSLILNVRCSNFVNFLSG